MVVALVAAMLILPVVAAEGGADTQEHSLGHQAAMSETGTEILSSTGTAISMNPKPREYEVAQLSPVIGTVYSTTHVHPAGCTGLTDLQNCPDTPLTVPKSEGHQLGWGGWRRC